MIEVYVGCSANGEDAESLMVLDYSIKKFASEEVNIHFMNPRNSITWEGWDTSLWATPFSGYRWSIPEHCGFSGKAIYMDSDMVILSDIAELWNQQFEPGKIVMAKGGEESWRFCVCMWNNLLAEKYILPLARLKSLSNAHQRMMNSMAHNPELVQPFKGNWNCIDGEDKQIEDIDILHYSDMSTQFHLKYAIPRLRGEGHSHWFDGNIHPHWRPDLDMLFTTMYNEALCAGYMVEDYIPNGEWIHYNKQSQANYDQYRNKWSQDA